MSSYEFTLKFSLPDTDADPEAYIDALAEAGCTDATIGLGQVGRIGLIFSREATSALAAIASAITDVRKAIPAAQLVEVTPDLVGLTDMAEVTGVSRQYMRKLWESNIKTFPVAVHEGAASLWHLEDALTWLRKHQGADLSAVLEVAQAARKVNIAKEARRVPGVALPADLQTLFA